MTRGDDRRHAWLIATVTMMMLLAACSATTTANVSAATVTIKDVQFVNGSARVGVGGQVVFDNKDTQPHTATAGDGTFDTGAIAPGTHQIVMFRTAGTFEFHCSFHPFMTGTVTVA